MPKILALAGSTRSGSFNKRLAALAAERARAAGAEVSLVDLRDFAMPLYDGDLEAEHGVPETANELRALMTSHDGLLLACPEYNGSITAVLKNAIDWVSRPVEGEAPMAAFRGKVAGLLAASPGALGGLRGLVHVRAILSGIGMYVVPTQAAVGKAHEALEDDATTKRVDGVVAQVVELATKLNA
ncbi:MAG: NADPH-dependent FMN reductase [Planctomycetota bacterium]|jgi:NAD(P)H-dependent FMN reductase